MKIARNIKKIIVKLVYFVYRCVYRFIPIDDKTVVFISFHGRGYSDNPRAIYEEMVQDERFKDYHFVWMIKKHKQKKIDIPKGKVVEYGRVAFFYYMAHAKYWVINCKMPLYMLKKEEQIYLQTWHGTPLKRLGCDIDVDENVTFYRSQMSFAKMCETYEVDSARYNYMISPNSFCTEIFPKAFKVAKEKIIETGYPRNDFITNASETQKTEILKKYNIPAAKKVILYAPTWRDNSYVASGYTFTLKVDFHAWKQILGDEYVVVFKPHYLIINSFEQDDSLHGFVYSMPATAEINELYVISDVLITDYSSVFFDYAVLNKPMYFYMYDKEEYQQDLRGFYLDVDTELPGKIYIDENEMVKDIKNNVYEMEKLMHFNTRFNHCQDGNCAKKVIDIVFR